MTKRIIAFAILAFLALFAPTAMAGPQNTMFLGSPGDTTATLFLDTADMNATHLLGVSGQILDVRQMVLQSAKIQRRDSATRQLMTTTDDPSFASSTTILFVFLTSPQTDEFPARTDSEWFIHSPPTSNLLVPDAYLPTYTHLGGKNISPPSITVVNSHQTQFGANTALMKMGKTEVDHRLICHRGNLTVLDEVTATESNPELFMDVAYTDDADFIHSIALNSTPEMTSTGYIHRQGTELAHTPGGYTVLIEHHAAAQFALTTPDVATCGHRMNC